MGLLAGTIGSRDVQITCLKCGKRFKAGEARIVKPANDKGKEFDQELINIIQTKGLLAAVKHHKVKTGCDLAQSKRYIDSLNENHGVTSKKQSNSGCTSVIVLMTILSVTLYFILS